MHFVLHPPFAFSDMTFGGFNRRKIPSFLKISNGLSQYRQFSLATVHGQTITDTCKVLDECESRCGSGVEAVSCPPLDCSLCPSGTPTSAIAAGSQASSFTELVRGIEALTRSNERIDAKLTEKVTSDAPVVCTAPRSKEFVCRDVISENRDLSAQLLQARHQLALSEATLVDESSWKDFHAEVADLCRKANNNLTASVDFHSRDAVEARQELLRLRNKLPTTSRAASTDFSLAQKELFRQVVREAVVHNLREACPIAEALVGFSEVAQLNTAMMNTSFHSSHHNASAKIEKALDRFSAGFARGLGTDVSVLESSIASMALQINRTHDKVVGLGIEFPGKINATLSSHHDSTVGKILQRFGLNPGEQLYDLLMHDESVTLAAIGLGLVNVLVALLQLWCTVVHCRRSNRLQDSLDRVERGEAKKALLDLHKAQRRTAPEAQQHQDRPCEPPIIRPGSIKRILDSLRKVKKTERKQTGDATFVPPPPHPNDTTGSSVASGGNSVNPGKKRFFQFKCTISDS